MHINWTILTFWCVWLSIVPKIHNLRMLLLSQLPKPNLVFKLLPLTWRVGCKKILFWPLSQSYLPKHGLCCSRCCKVSFQITWVENMSQSKSFSKFRHFISFLIPFFRLCFDFSPLLSALILGTLLISLSTSNGTPRAIQGHNKHCTWHRK